MFQKIQFFNIKYFCWTGKIWTLLLYIITDIVLTITTPLSNVRVSPHLSQRLVLSGAISRGSPCWIHIQPIHKKIVQYFEYFFVFNDSSTEQLYMYFVFVFYFNLYLNMWTQSVTEWKANTTKSRTFNEWSFAWWWHMMLQCVHIFIFLFIKFI